MRTPLRRALPSWVVFLLALGAPLLAVTPTDALAQRRIMIIGDSIQSGTGLHRTSNQASFRLEKQGNVVVHNFASPGARMTDTIFPGMNHAVDAVWLLHGFFGMYGLVINLGTNDWGQGADLATFSQNYHDFLAALPPSLNVACMGMTWSTAEGTVNANGISKDAFRDAIRAACTAMGKPYLEGKDAIPNSASYFADGVHPNDSGHRAMGAFLVRSLRDLGWLP
jgi:lysophospholipase L1-like esterase